MIYLASKSPRRRKLLQEAGIAHRVKVSNYTEKFHPRESPRRTVQRCALGKARDVAKRIAEGQVIGADTLVYRQGRLYGKPKNLKQAVDMLQSLQGRWHRVYTGVALLTVCGKKVTRTRLFVEVSRVWIRKMSVDEIRRYFKIVHPLDKAGAYAIQSPRVNIVQKVVGSFSNVAGLPVETLKKHLVFGR